MKTTKMSPTHVNHPRGFSLIVTVSILTLMALIALGLLTLSTVTVRSANLADAQLEARANARLALMIAIGELQRDLGPDQRVSAPSGIFDSSPDTPKIDGVDHPNWMVAFKTNWEGRPSVWTRDDNDGGLRDLRNEEGYVREDEALNYFVSGNEGGRAGKETDFLEALDASLNDELELVGPGSVEEDDDKVVVERVQTKKGDRRLGGYGWWIGDLGAKANVGSADVHRDKKIGNGPKGLERVLHALDVEEEMIEGFGEIEDADAGRVITNNTLALLNKVNGEGVKENFHAITTYSRSVLANVRDGGLQRDLTAFLESSGRIQALSGGSNGRTIPGLKDADLMVGPANVESARILGWSPSGSRYKDIAPNFRLVREWSRYAQGVPFSKKDEAMVAPEAFGTNHRFVIAMQNRVNVYDNANLRPASFVPYEKPNMPPVMVEGSIYYNIATFPAGATGSQWTTRLCFYPRVALWNPHNIEMQLPYTVAQLFVNGNKNVRLTLTNGQQRDQRIPMGRGSTKINGGAELRGRDRSPAHYVGTILFTMRPATIAPGETLVFSPERTGEYQLENIYRNVLTPTVAPDPSLYFYQDMTTKQSVPPTTFTEFPGGGNTNGADNYLMALKDASSTRGRPTDVNFDSLPLICYINPSLQAGGSDELPVQWNGQVPVHQLANAGATLPGNAIPDVRTRDGFRIRWWKETPSNLRGSGRLRSSPQHLETAAIATWNPRAAYFCRTPWDNVSDVPPYFYGMYTRDLFDPQVSWTSMTPASRNGKFVSFPFGPPVEGPEGIVLFEVPKKELGIPSIGYLRHMKLSEFGWHPSYAIGNSLVDPRVGRESTIPILTAQQRSLGGWNAQAYGWTSNQGYWAQLTREILFDIPVQNSVVYDQSFEANFNLWDDYFVSTGTPNEKDEFFEDPLENPLSNGSLGLFSSDGDAKDELKDFHRAAYRFALDGGFNVHSVEVEAWKAFLASTRDTGFGSENKTPFPRFVDPVGDETDGDDARDANVWNGFRSLSDTEIERLAEEMVVEVKKRAPFLGLTDFVNRRLLSDGEADEELAEKGAIQAAIDNAGINSAIEQEFPLNNSRDLPDVSFFQIRDATRLDQTLKPNTTAWGLPGFLTQGDVLQVSGSSLRARSDSFVIRAYGESGVMEGNKWKVRASVYCEAVVQRVPDPYLADGTGINSARPSGDQVDFGRRFRVVSFRWLNPDEV